MNLINMNLSMTLKRCSTKVTRALEAIKTVISLSRTDVNVKFIQIPFSAKRLLQLQQLS